MIIIDMDDFGCNHEISDMCQSHDCRDVLLQFKEANPAFKATLFAIPNEMTTELLDWSWRERDWIELAVHGFKHDSNYECENITDEHFGDNMQRYQDRLISPHWTDTKYFVKGFKAPGWMISDGVYDWLLRNGWWVADQAYNDDRRPKDLPVYKIGENSEHFHTWNCVGNGVYEKFDYIMDRIKDETDFKFVSEVI